PLVSIRTRSRRPLAHWIRAPAARAGRRAMVVMGSIAVSGRRMAGAHSNSPPAAQGTATVGFSGRSPALARRWPLLHCAILCMQTAMPGNFSNLRVVLVHTSHPGNIGAAARAMKNMGLDRLYLVEPREFPAPRALWRAAGATDVL